MTFPSQAISNWTFEKKLSEKLIAYFYILIPMSVECKCQKLTSICNEFYFWQIQFEKLIFVLSALFILGWQQQNSKLLDSVSFITWKDIYWPNNSIINLTKLVTPTDPTRNPFYCNTEVHWKIVFFIQLILIRYKTSSDPFLRHSFQLLHSPWTQHRIYVQSMLL